MSGIVGTSHSKSKVIGRSQDTAKAWIFLDGNVATYGIQDSFNISSVSTHATGVYHVNFDTPMPNANYAVAGGVVEDAGGYNDIRGVSREGSQTKSTTQFAFWIFDQSPGANDGKVSLVFFGD